FLADSRFLFLSPKSLPSNKVTFIDDILGKSKEIINMKTFFGRVVAVVVGITLFIIGCFILISILGALLGSGDKVKVDSGSVLKLDFKDPIYESDMEIQ